MSKCKGSYKALMIEIERLDIADDKQPRLIFSYIFIGGGNAFSNKGVNQ